MSAQQQPESFRHQDGQVLFAPNPEYKPHPQFRWECRAPDDWTKEDVRVAWREAEPVHCRTIGDEEYARYHAPTDMLLIAGYGFLSTVIPVSSYDESEQQYIREQVREGSGDV